MRKNPFLGKNLEKDDIILKKGKTKATPPAKIVLLGGDHSGRDEMNLAGNPFALLQAAGKNSNTSLIRYEWERTLPTGKIVTASWEVSGHSELGLPGPNDELLYLVLLQLTREAADESGVWPQTVHFSRYDVLRRLGWNDNSRDYRVLRDCFVRLANVSINADFAFWNPRAKAPFDSITFHILDDQGISSEPKGNKKQGTLPLSYFKWSDQMYQSFTAGNVRDLALDFVLSLELPTSRRLFRFLDMMRNAQKPPRREFTIGLLKLRDRLGMTNYKHASKIKEKLLNAHNELLERGYLAQVEYAKSKEGGELAIYRFGDGRTVSTMTAPANDAPQVQLETDEAVAPPIAYAVWQTLKEEQREALRLVARQGVEPAFWDRLERPDSPMGLKLWELVAKEYPQAYQKQLEQGREVR